MLEVSRILAWSEWHVPAISAVHIPGVDNWATYFLSLSLGEWSFNPTVLKHICQCQPPSDSSIHPWLPVSPPKKTPKKIFYDLEIQLFITASPAKSDASSVDIYDGLDTTTLTEQAVEKSSPSRTCLDLYEEILTEEGTAKETSFNDLSGKYENCQKQIKQLITRLKEMKSMNSSLQNENQCLKKNISALIKTARVEITRKEDEINRLNQRLGMPGMNHSFKPSQIPIMNINNRSQSDDLSKNIRNTENLPKKNITLQSKDITSHYSKNLCGQEKSCVKSSPTCPPVNKPISSHCKDSIMKSSHVEPPCLEANDTNKIQMGLDNLNKVTERNRTKERPKSSSANLVSENSDLKEKVRRSPLKCGRNDSSQEKRNSKSEASSEIEDRKYHSISYKEKMQLKDLDSAKEKEVRKYERSPHRRDSRAYEKEKKTQNQGIRHPRKLKSHEDLKEHIFQPQKMMVPTSSWSRVMVKEVLIQVERISVPQSTMSPSMETKIQNKADLKTPQEISLIVTTKLKDLIVKREEMKRKDLEMTMIEISMTERIKCMKQK
ncbi:unnamed protein product [Ranitomeya imitator]|uniref:Uncharacterized protein n=1 Tax=Ranitomeya imitator TaxID=111125 RepID=A0ABN9MKX3_9NEOB|nr:unnamed protein product [Ranitomeya imitator]